MGTVLIAAAAFVIGGTVGVFAAALAAAAARGDRMWED